MNPAETEGPAPTANFLGVMGQKPPLASHRKPCQLQSLPIP